MKMKRFLRGILFFSIVFLAIPMFSCGEKAEKYETDDLSGVRGEIDEYIINPNITEMINSASSSNIRLSNGTNMDLEDTDYSYLPDTLQEMQQTAKFITGIVKERIDKALLALPEENQWIAMCSDAEYLNRDAKQNLVIAYYKIDTSVDNVTTYTEINEIINPVETDYLTTYISIDNSDSTNEPIVEYYGDLGEKGSGYFYYIPGEYIYIDLFDTGSSRGQINHFVCRLNNGTFYAESGLVDSSSSMSELLNKLYYVNCSFFFGNKENGFIERVDSINETSTSYYKNGKKVMYSDEKSFFNRMFFDTSITNITISYESSDLIIKDGSIKGSNESIGKLYERDFEITEAQSSNPGFTYIENDKILYDSETQDTFKIIDKNTISFNELETHLIKDATETTGMGRILNDVATIKDIYNKYFDLDTAKTAAELDELINQNAYLEDHQALPFDPKQVIDELSAEDLHFLYETVGNELQMKYEEVIDHKLLQSDYSYASVVLTNSVGDQYSMDYEYNFSVDFNGFETNGVDMEVIFSVLCEDGTYVDFAKGDKKLVSLDKIDSYNRDEHAAKVSFKISDIMDALVKANKLEEKQYSIVILFVENETSERGLFNQSLLGDPRGLTSSSFCYFPYKNGDNYYNVKVHQANSNQLDYTCKMYFIIEIAK